MTQLNKKAKNGGLHSTNLQRGVVANSRSYADISLLEKLWVGVPLPKTVISRDMVFGGCVLLSVVIVDTQKQSGVSLESGSVKRQFVSRCLVVEKKRRVLALCF